MLVLGQNIQDALGIFIPPGEWAADGNKAI